MKHQFKFILLMGLIYSGVTQAAPVINDLVFFEGTYAGSSYTLERKLWKYDSATDIYTQHLAIFWAGSIPYHTVTIAAKDYMSEEKAAALVQNCEQEGGILEALTIKAGSFLACKRNVAARPAQINWYAAVPCGGVVKTVWEVSPGNIMDITLSSFKKGQ